MEAKQETPGQGDDACGVQQAMGWCSAGGQRAACHTSPTVAVLVISPRARMLCRVHLQPRETRRMHSARSRHHGDQPESRRHGDQNIPARAKRPRERRRCRCQARGARKLTSVWQRQ